MNKTKLTLMQYTGIIAVNAVCMLVLALTGGLAYMMQELAIDSSTAVLILMIPNFVAIPFCFLCGPLCAKIGSRAVNLIGLAIFTVTGVLPFFLSDVTMLLVVRALHGVGYGLCTTVTSILVNDYCDGEMLSKLSGIKQSVQNAFAVIYGIVGGALAVLNWRYSYLLYLLGIPVFLLSLAAPKIKTNVAKTVEKYKIVLTSNSWGWIVGMFIFMLSIACYSANMSEYCLVNGITDATGAGTAVSLSTACGFFAGLAFGSVFKKLKKWTMPLAILMVALTQALIPATNSYIVVLIASGVQGLAYSTAVPCAVVGISTSTDQRSASTAIGIMVAAMLLGNVVSNYILTPMANVMGGPTAANKYFAAAVIAVVAMVYFFVMSNAKKKAQSQAA